jgi:molybdenum cofactor cytidylyltransferase
MTPAQSECTLATPGHPCPRLRVVAIVLAAGTASRMGGRPKCLLKRDGQTLLQRLLDRLEAAGIDETVLVLGHHAEAVQRALDASPNRATGRRMTLHRVLNPQPTDGQNSSLHLGLAKAQTLAPDWLMVALADQPLLEAQDLQDLVAAVKNSPTGTQMLQPQVAVQTEKTPSDPQAQPGNPVMLSKVVMADLLAQGQGLSAADRHKLPGGKEWRQSHPQSFHPWPTANAHYRIDMDTPEDLAALQAQHGIQLVWDEGL